jgi:hypothetical protein
MRLRRVMLRFACDARSRLNSWLALTHSGIFESLRSHITLNFLNRGFSGGLGFGWNAIVRLACGRDVERNRKRQSAAKNFVNAAVSKHASGAKRRARRASRSGGLLLR